MAIYGVGIDLIRVDRLESSLARWGGRFEKRVFTRAELEACAGRRRRASCLAMRFAAKEAFVKALGTGMRAPVTWCDVEVRSSALGKPFIVLSERAAEYCARLGLHAWHVSLTDDGDYGAAVVMIETN
ncbi:MAG: holo-ACP synthase [Syntrophobacteraceae bacterium]|jgi:holo-[acyl-carrier protein] synthase|nr:holo-ACP synthase [Syntrophobacteraceae bacterium]